MKWTVNQRLLVAEFFSNLAVALIAVGGFGPLFDPKLPAISLITQFASSVLMGIFLLTSSVLIVKR